MYIFGSPFQNLYSLLVQSEGQFGNATLKVRKQDETTAHLY